MCSEASGRRFLLGKQSEAMDFLSWLLNAIHNGLGGGKKRNSTIIKRCFQGEVEVITTTKKRIKRTEEDNDDDNEVSSQEFIIYITHVYARALFLILRAFILMYVMKLQI